MASSGFIFIDANQYLSLYSVIKGKQLLNLLTEQQQHIFITAQIADEVQRNKLNIAKRFLSEQVKSLNVGKVNVPEHLFDVSQPTSKLLKNSIRTTAANAKKLRKALENAVFEHLGRISRSEDKVSKALTILFIKAIKPTSAELELARARKEIGNPPGKYKDVLGDQLSWEQLLNQYRKKQKVWLITGDSDFRTNHDGKLFLNPFLYQELTQIAGRAPEIFCFDNIDEGIRHFVKEMKVKTEALPTKQESEAIQDEWKSSSNVVNIMAKVMNSFDQPQAIDSYETLYAQGRRRNLAPFYYSSTGQQNTPLPLTTAKPQDPKEE